MATYKSFTEDVQQRLSHLYQTGEGRAIAVRLLQHFCKISSYEHIVNPSGVIDEQLLKSDLEQAVLELSKARPLQYVLGYEEFYGRKFNVEEGVLIPRPETEELVRWILDNDLSYPIRILDAACGSGCIGITLACEMTKQLRADNDLSNSEVFALDFSDKALEVTHRNAVQLSLGQSGMCKFKEFKADLMQGPDSQKMIENNSLDILVSNPPYVKESERILMRSNVLDFEPNEALFVPDDDPLLFYKALALWGSILLKPGGLIYLEINESLAAEIVSLLQSSWFEKVEVRQDFCGKNRMVKASLI